MERKDVMQIVQGRIGLYDLKLECGPMPNVMAALGI